MTVEISRSLKADTTLDEKLGGRIYPNPADIGTPVPYLVFQGLGSSPTNMMDCGSIDENNRYQFVVWHDDVKEAESIRLKASRVLEDVGFFYLGKHPDMQDEETKLHGRGWSMSYWSSR